MPSPKIENVTEEFQRFLGIQQAQTFSPMDITADAIARLLERRGNIGQLLGLWKEDFRSVLDADSRDLPEIIPAFKAFRETVTASLKVSTRRDGTPKTFKPYVTDLISSIDVGKTFRELGRSVVEGLWRPDATPELCAQLKERIESWEGQHTLAELLRQFCTKRPIKGERASGEANLKVAASRDIALAGWIASVVHQDWRSWLVLSQSLSVDEQLETMNALICLHLHVAMLWRLRDSNLPDIPPFFFAVVAAQQQESSCNRAAYNSFKFWRDRTEDAIKVVARNLIVAAADSDSELMNSLNSENWTKARLWAAIEIKERQRQTATNKFKTRVSQLIDDRDQDSPGPARGEVEELVVQALCEAFSGTSGPIEKTKEYLRNMGRGAGLVGPEGGSRRKRYQLDDMTLELLTRLHVSRDLDIVRSTETEKESVEAFLDDIFERYGIIITAEREMVDERIRSVREHVASPLGSILAHLPSSDAMARNRAILDYRLDELRLVRRYSDASAVIHVS
jgi:hypothetical protein